MSSPTSVRFVEQAMGSTPAFHFDFNNYSPLLLKLLNNINLDLQNLFPHFLIKYNSHPNCHKEHRLFIEYNGLNICYLDFFISYDHKTHHGNIYVCGSVLPQYCRHKYSTLLRAILTSFVYMMASRIASCVWTLNTYAQHPHCAKAILKYYNSRCIHIESTHEFIKEPALIQIIQQHVDCENNDLGPINIYTPINKENKKYADSILFQLLSQHSTNGGIVLPPSIIIDD